MNARSAQPKLGVRFEDDFHAAALWHDLCRNLALLAQLTPAQPECVRLISFPENLDQGLHCVLLALIQSPKDK